MKCPACGANAMKVGPNQYRCNYCTHQFEASAVDAAEKTHASPAGQQALPGTAPNERVLSGADIYEHVIDTIVEIYAANRAQKSVLCSSGFVVSEQGFVLTNAHAVLDSTGKVCELIQVKTNFGTLQAKVVAIGKPADGKNDSIDLCLLYVEGLCVTPNKMGDVKKLKNGERVYLIGNSLGSGLCITSGIISDKERAMPGLSYPYIMTDAAANSGNSGGPLYNEYGEVIGVLVAGIDGAKGMNYAIPANIAEAFLSYVVDSAKKKNGSFEALPQYAGLHSNYSAALTTVTTAFAGIKILMDAIEYIMKLFKKS